MQADGADLFPLDADMSLYTDDFYLDVYPIWEEVGGPIIASAFEFEAVDDDGTPLLGTIWTRQAREEVVAILADAANNGKMIEIRGRRSITRVPGTSRYWITAAIALAPSLGSTVVHDNITRTLLQ